VRAPIDGTVSILNANLGELVPPGRPVVSLIDYRNLWADLYVPESKLDYINVGDSVPVTTPTYPKARFQGRVSFISPKSEFVPGATASTPSSEESYFRVKVTIENRDQSGRKQLQPGMKVNVHFGKSS
jgi:HlyD family secretion protein